MAKEMNMDTLIKKLKTVSNTQDSIPMLSLWIIHHKSHHKKIVEAWLNMLKKSKNQHRLTLLYLCNDVVQNCARKNALIYKESFSDVLAEAVTHLRDSSIKPNVQRVVKIWAKRSIYDTEFTDQLLAALITNRAPEKLRNKLLVEYKASSLIDEIKKFKLMEDEIEVDQTRLKAIRMDVSNLDAIRKLKDKIGGEKFSKDFEESATQLEMFLKRYESYIESRKKLLDLLEHGTVYYHAQYHEAKIVVNAYQNFETRVTKMKKGIDKVKERYPPLPGKKVNVSAVNQGEDMEMSDDDKVAEKKPTIISFESKRRMSKTIDKPTSTGSTAVDSTGDTEGQTANVIKLLATGLNSLKNSNQSAAESLKRVMTGLVNRPGMRGASFSTSSDSSVVKTDPSKTSFTIVRSVSESASSNLKEIHSQPSPPGGEESPPSPTGSPELNISPRMQSLDSRLADLFNEEGAGKSQAEESDSGSDSELIKRANRLLDMKSESILPGLGDLDEVENNNIADQSQAVEELPASQLDVAKPSTVTSAMTPSDNQSIPVIGGLSRIAVPMNDGASTPTLDEQPYNPPAYNVQPEISTSSFGSDALSFLTKIMGNAAKPEANVAESSTLPAAQPSSHLFPTYAPLPSWPPVNPPAVASTTPSGEPSTGVSNVWSSTPAPSAMPPPPIFSWTPSADPSLPPPWPSPTLMRPSVQATVPPISTSPVASVNSTSTSFVGTPQPSYGAPPQSSSFGATLPTPASLATIPNDLNTPPAAKKSKWDEHGDLFRRNAHVTMSNDVLSSVAPSISDRRSNLITVSSGGAIRITLSQKPTDDLQNVELRHRIPSAKAESPPRNERVAAVTGQDDVAPQPLSQQPVTGSGAPKRYDERGNPIEDGELEAIHRRIKEARLNSYIHRSVDHQSEHWPPHNDRNPMGDSDYLIKERMDPDAPPKWDFKPRLGHSPRLERPHLRGEFLRPPHDNHHPRERFPPPSRTAFPMDSHPLGPSIRRRSVNGIEMEILRHERQLEEEIIRDTVMLDEIDRMLPQARDWGPRPRIPPPSRYPRPHGPQIPPMRGMRPRMRF